MAITDIAPQRRWVALAPALLAATLGSCGATAPERVSASGTLSGEGVALAAITQPDATLALELRAGDEFAPVLARLDGVRLVLASGSSGRVESVVPFTHCTTVPDGSLRLECRPRQEHTISLEFSIAGPGAVRCEVETRVALRSRVFEIALEWRIALDPTALAEVLTPFPHDGADEVAGDSSFCSPLTYLRAGATAFALSPDLALLSRERRIPQAVQLRRDRDGIRVCHGLIAHRLVELEPPRVRYTKAGTPPIELRAETTRFAQRLTVTTTAEPERTLAALHREFWQRERVTTAGRGPGALGRLSIEARARSFVAGALAASWRPLPKMSGIETGTYSAADGDGMTAHFEAHRQVLRLALADAAVRGRDESLDPIEARAERVMQLALVAPRRGGMVPARFELNSGTGARRWTRGGAQPPTLTDHYQTAHAATTGLWLLALGDVVPKLRARSLIAATELARFLAQNQGEDGSIPSFYEPEYLQPRRRLFGENSEPESGFAALFLAAFAQRSARAGAGTALASARRAVDRLAMRDTSAPWPDFETLAGTPGGGTAPRPMVSGTLALIAAARAAFKVAALSAVDREPVVDAGARFCDALARAQFAWSPNWVDEPMHGSIRATSGVGPATHDARTAAAADAFFGGYLATGRRDLLQRGVAAIRTALAGPSLEGTGGPSTLERRAAALAIYEQRRAALGQGVVDLAAGSSDRAFAEAIDALWFEEFAVDEEGCRFRLLTEATFDEPVRIVFRNLPEDSEETEVTVNGENLGAVTFEQLAAGLSLRPQRVPRFEFRPPASILQGAAWDPIASFEHDGPLPDGTSAAIVWSPAGSTTSPARIALEPAPAKTLLPFVTGPEMGLEIGTAIDAYLEVKSTDGRTVRVPASGTRRIVIGAKHCIDPGDDDERNLVDAGRSRIVRFPTGRENARQIGPDDRITYSIPVPSSVADLAIEATLSGAVRVTSGPHVLHVDDGARPEPHDIALQLGDPRLWRQDGALPLTFEAAAAAPCAIAQIRYLAGGRTTRVEGPTSSDAARAPDSRLRIAVVPLAFPDAELTFDERAIERVFFGGDYRRTPEPESRLTTGSVAELIERLSGGVSTLRGSTLAAQHATQPRSQTDPADRATAAERLAATIDVGLAIFRAPLDAAVVVYAGTPLPGLETAKQMLERDGFSSIPLIFVAERAADGSVLPSGKALLALLDRIYTFEPLGDEDAGRFGAFSLAARGGGHTPTSLAGINAVRTRWAEVRRVVPNADNTPIAVSVSAVGRSRALLRLPFSELPFRPDLDLETHSISTAEPWRKAAGALIYWTTTAAAAPVVTLPDGGRCSPRYLRLSPSWPTWRTPFIPASSDDLFRASDQLDGRSTPSLATLRGDILWSIERLRGSDSDGGVTDLRIRHHATDLLAEAEIRWRTGVGDALGPLAPDVGAGAAERARSLGGWRVTPRTVTAATMVGSCTIPAEDHARRLFGRITAEGADTADVIVRVGGEIAVTGTCADPAGLSFEIDLEPSLESTACEVQLTRRNPGSSGFVIERLLLFRRTEGRRPVRFDLEDATSTPLCDGVVYAKTRVIELDPTGSATLDAPLLGAAGAHALRLVVGLEASASDAVRMTATLRGAGAVTLLENELVVHDGTAERHAPRTFLAALPEQPADSPAIRFLKIDLKGKPGTRIHLLGCALE